MSEGNRNTGDAEDRDALIRALVDRITSLENSVTFLQHDLDALNAALLRQDGVIREVEARFTRLESRVNSMQESSEERDPEAERPPHY